MREKSKGEHKRKNFSFDKDGHVTVKDTCGMHQDQKRKKDEVREKGSGNGAREECLLCQSRRRNVSNESPNDQKLWLKTASFGEVIKREREKWEMVVFQMEARKWRRKWKTNSNYYFCFNYFF